MLRVIRVPGLARVTLVSEDRFYLLLPPGLMPTDIANEIHNVIARAADLPCCDQYVEVIEDPDLEVHGKFCLQRHAMIVRPGLAEWQQDRMTEVISTRSLRKAPTVPAPALDPSGVYVYTAV